MDGVSDKQKIFRDTEEKESEVHRSSIQIYLTNIAEGKLLCKRGGGRPKKPYLEVIKHCIQIRKYTHIKGAAFDRL